MHFTDRDIRILRWVGEQFIVNARELEDLLVWDAYTHGLPELGMYFVRDLLNRWRTAGLVQTVYQLRRGSHAFLTAQGIRASGLPYVPRTPGVSDVAHLTHHDGVNQVRLALEQQAWRGRQVISWQSERSLMQQEKHDAQQHPHAARIHRPDALILTGDAKIAIEVERAYKRPGKLRKVLGDYLLTDRYSQVRYFCESEAIQHGVERAVQAILDELPAAQREHLAEKVIAEQMPKRA